MPSAVDIMNYISSGLLWRIFCQTGDIFSPYISFITLKSSIRELYCTFTNFYKIFLYIILILLKGIVKLRWAGWGAEYIIFFKLPRSSLRVRRSSVGSSVDQKGTA